MPPLLDVSTVADARAGLSRLLAGFRAAPQSAAPIYIGSHRKPEAVLIPYARFVSREGLTVSQSRPVLELVQAKKALVQRLATLNHVTTVAVFGSVAEGSETESSDIDLLVDLDDQASLFDLAQFEIDLEQLFGRPIDAVSRASLDRVRDAAILDRAVAL